MRVYAQLDHCVLKAYLIETSEIKILCPKFIIREFISTELCSP